MATKFKGIFKGFKYISQIFVYKEHEMEIGYPTDVRHVSHIGWDGTSMNAPSWMNEFTNASDFSSTSLGNLSQSRDLNSGPVASWSSQDCQQSMGTLLAAEIFTDSPNPELPRVPKKTKQKRNKVSSPHSMSSRSFSMRSSKSKGTFAAEEGTGSQLGLI